MHMMVHCPGCHQALQVPTDASGRYARCPVCRTKFIIPNPDELFEETVSTWIEEDLDQYMWEQEESADQADAGVPADQPPQRDSSPRDVEQQVGSEDHEQLQPPDERPETPVARRAASQLTSGDTMVAMAVPESAQPADKRRAPAASRPAESERAGGSIDHDQHQLDVQDQEDLGSSGVPIDGGSSANEGSRTPYLTAPPPASITTYPQQLHVTEPIPRLAVKEVFQQGVTFCFDSLWVEHDGFRASFPVACAFCGAADRKHLMSKPMAFADRAMDKNRSAREIENDYEHGVRERSPAQLLQVTGRLAGMLKPFASPVLYYTCSKHHQQAMECTTVDRSDGASPGVPVSLTKCRPVTVAVVPSPARHGRHPLCDPHQGHTLDDLRRIPAEIRPLRGSLAAPVRLPAGHAGDPRPLRRPVRHHHFPSAATPGLSAQAGALCPREAASHPARGFAADNAAWVRVYVR